MAEFSHHEGPNAAEPQPTLKEKLLNGYTVGGMTYKVHLDGYNQIRYLTGAAKESARNAIMYMSDGTKSVESVKM